LARIRRQPVPQQKYSQLLEGRLLKAPISLSEKITFRYVSGRFKLHKEFFIYALRRWRRAVIGTPSQATPLTQGPP
jgi:hypothetical protein